MSCYHCLQVSIECKFIVDDCAYFEVCYTPADDE